MPMYVKGGEPYINKNTLNEVTCAKCLVTNVSKRRRVKFVLIPSSSNIKGPLDPVYFI